MVPGVLEATFCLTGSLHLRSYLHAGDRPYRLSGGWASVYAVAEVWRASKLRRVSGRRPVKMSRAKYVEKETGATEIGDAQESANGVSAQ